MFGSSGHESGEVSDEGVMRSVFIGQKQEVNGVYTISMGANIQWNQFSFLVRHNADRNVDVLAVSYTHLTLPTNREV